MKALALLIAVALLGTMLTAQPSEKGKFPVRFKVTNALTDTGSCYLGLVSSQVQYNVSGGSVVTCVMLHPGDVVDGKFEPGYKYVWLHWKDEQGKDWQEKYSIDSTLQMPRP